MRATGNFFLGQGDRQASDGLDALMSNGNAVTKPTTAGYAWRACSWIYFDAHGLGSVNKAITRCESIGKKLTMCIRVQEVPAWVLAKASASERFTTTLSGGLGKRTTVVPWCASALAAYDLFLRSLADYRVGKSKVRFADHPLLAGVRVSTLGMKHPGRDVELYYRLIRGYTRAKYIAATLQAIGMVRQRFPLVDLYGGMFRTKDTSILTTALIDAIASEFPGFGLFEELWTETKPAGNNLADLRHGMSKGLPVLLQELDSSGTFAKRLAYAEKCFGQGYRECYQNHL